MSYVSFLLKNLYFSFKLLENRIKTVNNFIHL